MREADLIETKHTVEFGELKIYNVPVNENKYGETYYRGSVSLLLSDIYKYMKRNNLKEFDYDNR